MAQGGTVQVIGGRRLVQSLDRFSQQVKFIVPGEMIAIIGQVAVMKAPKETGRLSASFNGYIVQKENPVVVLRFGIRYSAAVHFGVGPRPGLRGAHNVKPNPYLSDAIEQTRPRWEESYIRKISAMCYKVRGA